MKEQLVNCCKIMVDCVKNDPVDIRCGGPEYLGFDFNVRVEETKKNENIYQRNIEKFRSTTN